MKGDPGADIPLRPLYPRVCSIEGCEKPGKQRGWCGMHYMRWLTFGDPSIAGSRIRGDSTGKERLKVYVERTDTCWNWTGTLSKEGYGSLYIHATKRNSWAHRLSYELHVGPIPAGLQLDHLCRNRACVNPDHLEPVSAFENNRRSESPSAINARRVFCKHGHKFTPENTRFTTRVKKNGERIPRRVCRACHRVQAKRSRDKEATT